MSNTLTARQIAHICHDANRALCRTMGNYCNPTWEHAPESQRKCAEAGVKAVLENPSMTAADFHAAWLEYKEREGWAWGPVVSPELKLHPCMVPYEELPEGQRRKDRLFRAIVLACIPSVFHGYIPGDGVPSPLDRAPDVTFLLDEVEVCK